MKTALVTGGSRGIGLGIVRALAGEGYNLAINGVREESEVTVLTRQLQKEYGIEVIYCQGNVGSEGDRKKIFDKVISHFGGLNVLINNAGVAPKNRLDVLDIGEEDYDYVMDINLKGVYFLTQQFARQMILDKEKDSSFEGCIVTISSVSAVLASINRGEYCLSKAGLSMMTKLMAVRMAAVDIPVYEIQPGVIATDMTEKVQEKYDKMLSEGLTLQKRWGTPEDIGKIVAALVRGDLPYCTGQVISPDGGMMVGRL